MIKLSRTRHALRFAKCAPIKAKIAQSNTETAVIKTLPILEIQEKEYLSLEEAATLLGVSRTTLYRMRRDGALKFGAVGKKKVISRKSIDQLVNPNS